MRAALRSAITAAEKQTGKRFGLLVASSLVATSAIVASALTGVGGNGALAALLAHRLGASAPVATTASSPVGEPSAPAGTPSGDNATPSSPPTPAPQASEPSTPSSPASPSQPESPSAPETETGPVKHVFLVSLASPGFEAAFGVGGEMPYLAGELRPQGTLLSGYSLVSGAGLPNSIAALSGQPPNPATEANCPAYADCLYPVETLTLADQLSSARLSWRAYVEGMTGGNGRPQSCVHPEPGAADQPTPGAYAARQNPFVYFHSLLDLGACASDDVPMTQLARDLRNPKSTPNFAYIAPTLCDAGAAGACPEGTAGGAAAADAFLSRVVPEILASPAYKQDGLLIVAFDEAVPGEGAANAEPTRTGALFVSPFAAPGATDAAPYTPYALLRSIEDLFGLPHLAKAGGPEVRSFADALLRRSGGD